MVLKFCLAASTRSLAPGRCCGGRGRGRGREWEGGGGGGGGGGRLVL